MNDKCPHPYDPDCEECNRFIDEFLDEHSDLMDDLAKLEEAEKKALEELDRKKNGEES